MSPVEHAEETIALILSINQQVQKYYYYLVIDYYELFSQKPDTSKTQTLSCLCVCVVLPDLCILCLQMVQHSNTLVFVRAT